LLRLSPPHALSVRTQQ